jgi:hypothetical protein
MGIEEGEEGQAKGMCNIFNNTIEVFPSLKKQMPFQVQEAFWTTNGHDQNGTSPLHIIVKTISTEDREKILQAVIKKNQITYVGKPIKVTADFSTETLKIKRAWSDSILSTERKQLQP